MRQSSAWQSGHPAVTPGRRAMRVSGRSVALFRSSGWRRERCFSAARQPISDPPVLSPTDLVDLLSQVQGNSPPSIDDVSSNAPQTPDNPKPPTDLTPAFRVYDGASIIGKPNLTSAGVYNALTTGEVLEWNTAADTWGDPIDPAGCDAVAARAAASGSPFIIDIESWKLDPLGAGYVTPNADGSIRYRRRPGHRRS